MCYVIAPDSCSSQCQQAWRLLAPASVQPGCRPGGLPSSQLPTSMASCHASWSEVTAHTANRTMYPCCPTVASQCAPSERMARLHRFKREVLEHATSTRAFAPRMNSDPTAKHEQDSFTSCMHRSARHESAWARCGFGTARDRRGGWPAGPQRFANYNGDAGAPA